MKSIVTINRSNKEKRKATKLAGLRLNTLGSILSVTKKGCTLRCNIKPLKANKKRELIKGVFYP